MGVITRINLTRWEREIIRLYESKDNSAVGQHLVPNMKAGAVTVRIVMCQQVPWKLMLTD